MMDYISTTEPALKSLLDSARQAAQQAYSPYSGFRVGAALRLTNGEIVTGANVENVSYGLTICAERSALVRAVSQFGPDIRVEAVAIANLNDAPSPPCGACRQVPVSYTHLHLLSDTVLSGSGRAQAHGVQLLGIEHYQQTVLELVSACKQRSCLLYTSRCV